MRTTLGLLTALLVVFVACFATQMVSEQPRAPGAGEDDFCMREDIRTGIAHTDGEPAIPWSRTYVIAYLSDGGAPTMAEQDIIDFEMYDGKPRSNEAWCQEVTFPRRTCSEQIRERKMNLDAQHATGINTLMAIFATGRKSRRAGV